MNTYTHWHLGSTALKYEGDWNIPILTPIQSSPEWGVRGDQSVFTDVYMKGLHDGNRPLGRYLLTNDGEARKLDPTDSSKYLDGSPVNEEDGDVMVYLPKLYYKVTTEDFDGTPCEVLHCSVSPISGGRVTGGTYLGAYMASMDSEGKLHSRSDETTKVSTPIQGFHDAAKKNGERYGIMSYMQWCQLMMIQLSACGSPDAQSKVGFGGQFYGSKPHGFTKTMGDQSGSGENDSVNFFGLENLWNNNWQFLQGISTDGDLTFYVYDQTELVSPDNLVDRFSNRSDYRRIKTTMGGGIVDTGFQVNTLIFVPVSTRKVDQPLSVGPIGQIFITDVAPCQLVVIHPVVSNPVSGTSSFKSVVWSGKICTQMNRLAQPISRRGVRYINPHFLIQ